MIDVKFLIRSAYYNCLNGKMTYNGNPVPINDDANALIATNSYPYVILSSQTGQWMGTLASFDSQEEIVLDIVYKSTMRAPKSVVDNVAGQIVNLVCPSPYINGLPTNSAISINNVRLIHDTYITLALNAADSVIRRLLTFRQYVRQR